MKTYISIAAKLLVVIAFMHARPSNARSFETEESSTGNPISELCQETEDGLAYFLEDPDNCSQYYMCQLNLVDFEYQWIAIHMSCPAPLQFDINLNVCNYAEEVGCVDN